MRLWDTYAVQAAVLSLLCGCRTAENRKYTARWTARFRDFPHVPRVLAEKLNMFNFSARILRKAMKRNREDREDRIDRKQNVNLPRPSARQLQPSADQNICGCLLIVQFQLLSTNDTKKAALKCLFILQPLRFCTVAQTADFSGLPQYQSHTPYENRW